MVKKLFLSPHNDDETLFGAYTLMKERPLVVVCTDSYIQQERGDGVTKEERIEETKKAMELQGIDLAFLHIPDSYLGYRMINEGGDVVLKDKLKQYQAELVFAPAIEEGGNAIHNLVGKVADDLFPNVIHYMTYIEGNEKTHGNTLIVPTQEMRELKKQALGVYQSQMKIGCRKYFTHPEVLDWESYE